MNYFTELGLRCLHRDCLESVTTTVVDEHDKTCFVTESQQPTAIHPRLRVEIQLDGVITLEQIQHLLQLDTSIIRQWRQQTGNHRVAEQRHRSVVVPFPAKPEVYEWALACQAPDLPPDKSPPPTTPSKESSHEKQSQRAGRTTHARTGPRLSRQQRRQQQKRQKKNRQQVASHSPQASGAINTITPTLIDWRITDDEAVLASMNDGTLVCHESYRPSLQR